jgi:2-C-methyl-D-erythritol 4-phosphate cytidylyltransferase/2-C-methyl-D-erythritol 2,4-cyclodiphosphate synthase
MPDLRDPLAHPPSLGHVVIVPAAGVGSRMGADRPKQYLNIGVRTVLDCTVQALLDAGHFDRVVVVVSPSDHHARQLPFSTDARVAIVPVGGATRRDSVLAGLRWLRESGLVGAQDWVWVHDAARPGIAAQDLHRLAQALASDVDGALLALPVADTLRREARGATLPSIEATRPNIDLQPGPDSDLRLASDTLSRDGLWQAQTPQVFRCEPLIEALHRHPDVTDEAAAMQAQGARVGLVAGSRQNFKITTADDLQTMRSLLLGADAPGGPAQALSPKAGETLGAAPWRIGQGWDVHALVPGRALILGGVQIPFERGLLGHSDADVLLHAITDALLGAAGLGDIGRHFPDTDPQFAGADSRVLLRETARRVQLHGWALVNLDATIVAQSPRLAPHLPAMQQHLSADLGVGLHQVNVKAKTSERLGFAGRGEGIEAHAVVLLMRR